MELGVILYWMVFYSVLAGWYARVKPVVTGNPSIDVNRYILPRILLAHVFSGYLLVLIFYIFSMLNDNIWVLSFLVLSILCTTEYFWIRLGEVREKLTGSLTVKIVLIALGVIVVFYFSSLSSTHLEVLTKVSPEIFSPFENLLTFVLSSLVWIVLAQFFVVIISFFYMVKLFIDKDDYVENLLFITVSGVASAFLLLLVVKSVFNDAIPYLLDNQFVSNMYHSNEDLDGEIICINRKAEEKIVLLPMGGISIATLDNERKWIFTVDVCERKVEKTS